MLDRWYATLERRKKSVREQTTHSSFKCIAFFHFRRRIYVITNQTAVFWEASRRASEEFRSVQMSACLYGSVSTKPTWMVTHCYSAGKQRLHHTSSKHTHRDTKQKHTQICCNLKSTNHPFLSNLLQTDQLKTLCR